MLYNAAKCLISFITSVAVKHKQVGQANGYAFFYSAWEADGFLSHPGISA